MKAWRRRFAARRRSLFWHLTVVLVVTGAVVNLVVFIAVRALFSPEIMFRGMTKRNIDRYAYYVVRDIGNPPNEQRLQEVAGEMGLAIAVELPSGRVTTEAGLPTLAELRSLHRLGRPRPFGHWGDRIFFVRHEANATYLFFMPASAGFLVRVEFTVIMVLALSLAVFGSHSVLRRLLRPLEDLTAGARAVGSGNFDYKMKTYGSAELKLLAQSFNDMATRIRDMVKVKDEMLIAVSHELRSPLTRMKVALAMMPESKGRAQIDSDIVTIDRMVEQILEAARTHQAVVPTQVANIDLAPLIAETVASFAAEAPGIVAQGHACAGPLMVSADPHLVHTVLRNVIENAMKYSRDSTSPVTIEAESLGNLVRLTISDHGIGIPAAEAGLVFEPFYRVDKARGHADGHGLGLAICKKYMLSQGGHIALASEVGKGTVVTLDFRCSSS